MSDNISIDLADGRTIVVQADIADQVRGVDADGDLVISLGPTDSPFRHQDGTEYLIPLTPCCHATGKGSVDAATGVVCRACYLDVGAKYASHTRIAVPTAHRHPRPISLLPRSVQRAIEIAAAGGHHVLLQRGDDVERPLPAQWLYHLLPDRTACRVPPLRQVDAATTVPELVGTQDPGECSLAHGGLLILSQLNDCSPDLLDALCPVLDHRSVTVCSGDRATHRPADFTLCAVTGPMPKRLSATFPRLRLAERLDVLIPATSANAARDAVADRPDWERIRVDAVLAAARRRVAHARARAASRWSTEAGAPVLSESNATVPASVLHQASVLPVLLDPIERALAVGSLTTRGATAVLRLAFTAADLDNTSLAARHITEALHLRAAV